MHACPIHTRDEEQKSRARTHAVAVYLSLLCSQSLQPFQRAGVKAAVGHALSPACLQPPEYAHDYLAPVPY